MSLKGSKAIKESPEGVKEYHIRYLTAVNNPIRRKILKALRDGDATVEALKSKTGLDMEMLVWHLDMLEYGFCVEKEIRNSKIFYKLTKEGRVIDYIEH